MLRVGVVGASGYSGQELIRLLLQHPGVRITALTAERFAGHAISSVFPSLLGKLDMVCEKLSPGELVGRVDVAFLGLPWGEAMSVTPPLLKAGAKVVDMSADYRFRDPAIYREWYGKEHANPHLTGEAVYGLPELYRESIKGASLVANPGCYPVSAILGLAPLLRNRLAEPKPIIIDSKSGVSGAGRKADLGYMFAELNEDFRAYSVASHRHAPEMEQELSLLAEEDVSVCFVPHLLPVTRGILSTIYVQLRKRMGTGDMIDIYRKHYAGEPFVVVRREGDYPRLRDVRNSNLCHISVKVDERADRAVIISAIDNLGKGASWNAVQNMNIMHGFDEGTAISAPPDPL